MGRSCKQNEGQQEHSYNFYWKVHEQKATQEGLGCRWEDNIRMDLAELGIERMNWIQLAENRDQWGAFINSALNLQIHKWACMLATSITRSHPMNFFLWREMKCLVYQTPLDTEEELVILIAAAGMVIF